MTNLLKKYIRNEHGQRIGVVLANKNGVGFSLCSKKDRYSEELALKIAINRANFKHDKREIGVPIDIAHEFYAMEIRRKNYFKV